MDAEPRLHAEEQMAHLVVQEISGFLKASGVIPQTPDYTYRFERIEKDISDVRQEIKEIRQDMSTLRDTLTRHTAYVAALVIASTLFLRFWPS